MRSLTKFVHLYFSLFVLLLALSISTAHSSSTIPIIPGATGYGSHTTAGSGRYPGQGGSTVYKVTNLNPNGVGSLQECIYASGPRTCVFEVSGTIDLTGDKSYGGSEYINLKNSFITIAGQTAPSPGITVKGKTLRIEAHDVLIQHLRFRLGDSLQVANRPDVRDTILISGNNDYAHRTPHNIVIDHCSVSWGVDEVVSIKDSSHSITLTNNIISEGLDRSLHPKGRHSKGLMAVGNKLSIYRNLITNIQDRAPLDISPDAEYVNNLSHNAKYATLWPISRSSFFTQERFQRQAKFVANVRGRGSNTADRGENVWGKANSQLSSDAQIHAQDNHCVEDDQSLVRCDLMKDGEALNNADLALPADLDVWPAHQVSRNISLNVGARPLDRDAVDRRLIQEVASNSGKAPDCVSAEPIYYPSGSVAYAEWNRIVVDLGHCYAGRFDGQEVEVYAGAGQGQTRTVVEHTCSASGANSLLVDSKWLPAVNKTSRIHIKNSCMNNAGGWPELEENRRTLSLPDDYNQLLPSGYTKLEEYLHSFYDGVEPPS